MTKQSCLPQFRIPGGSFAMTSLKMYMAEHVETKVADSHMSGDLRQC